MGRVRPHGSAAPQPSPTGFTLEGAMCCGLPEPQEVLSPAGPRRPLLGPFTGLRSEASFSECSCVLYIKRALPGNTPRELGLSKKPPLRAPLCLSRENPFFGRISAFRRRRKVFLGFEISVFIETKNRPQWKTENVIEHGEASEKKGFSPSLSEPAGAQVYFASEASHSALPLSDFMRESPLKKALESPVCRLMLQGGIARSSRWNKLQNMTVRLFANAEPQNAGWRPPRPCGRPGCSRSAVRGDHSDCVTLLMKTCLPTASPRASLTLPLPRSNII
ncbi:hypothetical protein H8959_013403 [Pygathrix nigripes]